MLIVPSRASFLCRRKPQPLITNQSNGGGRLFCSGANAPPAPHSFYRETEGGKEGKAARRHRGNLLPHRVRLQGHPSSTRTKPELAEEDGEPQRALRSGRREAALPDTASEQTWRQAPPGQPGSSRSRGSRRGPTAPRRCSAPPSGRQTPAPNPRRSEALRAKAPRRICRPCSRPAAGGGGGGGGLGSGGAAGLRRPAPAHRRSPRPAPRPCPQEPPAAPTPGPAPPAHPPPSRTCAPRVRPRPLSCPCRSCARMLVAVAARAPRRPPPPGPGPPAAAAAMAAPPLGRRQTGSAPSPRRFVRSGARGPPQRPLPGPARTAPPPERAAGGGPLGNVVRLGVARMRGGASRQGAGGEGGRAIPRRPPGSPPTLPGRLRRSLLGAAEAAGPWQEGAQVYFRYNAPLCFTGTVLFLLLPAEVSGPDTQAELKSTAQNPRSCLNQMKETTKQRPVTAWRAQTTRQTFKTKLLCPGRQGESCRHTNCWAKQNCNASKGYKKKPNPTLKVRGDRAPWEDRGELLTKVQAAAPRDLRGDSGPKGTTITSGRPTPSLAYWRLSRGLEILSPARQSSPAPLLGERARNAASDMGAQNHDRFKRGPWLIFHFNFPLLYKEQEKAMKTLGINMMLSNTAQPVLWWHLGDIFGSFPASHLTTPLTTMNNAWAWWWSQFYL